ncbi:Thiol-disulfide oxidoreductase ResA [Phycisphaerales bacterium]|nr:Thiol-disulfide oxidoreductase ResA [Phycisphaerales bacterium]
MKRTTLLAVTLALCAGSAAWAQDKAPATATPAKAQPATTLKVGDKAPALAVTNWVKGDAVTGFEKGRPYVVEFWATWCGPCIASMPHLSELQAEYKSKGLVIVGVSTKDPNNSLEQVQTMVKDKGDGMGYTVAYDGDKATNEAYMKASGQRGIPCSFVVDKTGTLAYIGHPMFLDPVLEKVVAGTWDVKTDPKAIADIQEEYFGVYRSESPADTLKKIASIESKYPSLAKGLMTFKYKAQMESGDTAGAAATGKVVVENAIKSKNAMDLNEIAWGIVDPEANVKNPDLDLALKAANAANTITGDKDAAILDTLARVYWLKGDKAKAIDLQTKAVANAQEGMKADLEKTLSEYKGAK